MSLCHLNSGRLIDRSRRREEALITRTAALEVVAFPRLPRPLVLPDVATLPGASQFFDGFDIAWPA